MKNERGGTECILLSLGLVRIRAPVYKRTSELSGSARVYALRVNMQDNAQNLEIPQRS